MGFGGSLIYSFMILTILSNNLPVSVNGQGLSVAYYRNSCPFAESFFQTIGLRYILDLKIARAMIKLHYSDCFVEGCDGSVLISGPNTERTADGNRDLLGFDVIDRIKSQLDQFCPEIVSCSDILAVAARDAFVLFNGPRWDVKFGRRDGRVSLAANVKNLPSNNDNVTVLLSKFAAFGLNTQDFVALIGAPTIRKPACTYISDFIFNKTEPNNERPLLVYLEKQFVDQLRASCYLYYLVETPHFHSFPRGDAVLKMDLRLLTDPKFYRVFPEFVTNSRFKTILARAMDKMSKIGVKIGGKGEVRRFCYEVNKP